MRRNLLPRRLLAVTAVLAACTGVVSGAAGSASAATAELVSPSAGGFTVHGRGNGHGHGMSQYGAQGAAIAGLSTARILAFYYPHTTLHTLAPSTIRVRLSDAGSSTTVFAGTSGLAVTGYGSLPATGYRYFRLSPYGSGLALAGKSGSSWKTLSKKLPPRADFHSSAGYVQTLLGDGTSTRYRGTIGAVRSGSGELTINRVSLDYYAAGVAPREMPASWRPAAVAAQAVAARTYGRNGVENNSGRAYDICDTTSCQVYGGMAHYDSSGDLLWSDDPAATANNHNQVLTYEGRTIFAQFSASNGGATVDGGLPYLVGKSDPYDNAASGDPYLTWSARVPATALASYYGLHRVTSIEITRRDGHGPWGGRVVGATINGTDFSGATTHLHTDGFALASAVGARTSFIRFDTVAPLPATPRVLSARTSDGTATVHWTAPSNAAQAGVSSYDLTWGGHSLTVGASARSAFVAPINLHSPDQVYVRAVGTRGNGRWAALTVHASASPQGIVRLAPARLVDTRRAHQPVTTARPLRLAVAGHGSIPSSGAHSVQLAISILHPSAGGHLSIYTDGAPAVPAAVLSYAKGRFTTSTVSVPLQPSGTIVFRPSAGTLDLLADQESYTASSGRRILPVAPALVASVPEVGSSSAVSFTGTAGVSHNTKAVLVSVEAWTSKSSATLRLWPDGAATPIVTHVAVTAGGPSVDTVLVPLPASRRLRLSSDQNGVSARVTLVGLVGNGGGLLETFPAAPIADDSLAGHPAVRVGTATMSTRIVGIAHAPGRGVSAVLAQITVTSGGTAGRLYVWPRGTARPDGAALWFPAHGSVTTTALLKIGSGGAVSLASTVPGARVSLSSMGYLTQA